MIPPRRADPAADEMASSLASLSLLLLCLPLSESVSLIAPKTYVALQPRPGSRGSTTGSHGEGERRGGGAPRRGPARRRPERARGGGEAAAPGGPHGCRRAAAERHPDDLRHVRRPPRRAAPRRRLHGQLLRHRHRLQLAGTSSLAHQRNCFFSAGPVPPVVCTVPSVSVVVSTAVGLRPCRRPTPLRPSRDTVRCEGDEQDQRSRKNIKITELPSKSYTPFDC